MLIDSNFLILKDNLSASAHSDDIHTLEGPVLILEHGNIDIEVRRSGSGFAFSVRIFDRRNADITLVESVFPYESLDETLAEMCGMVLDYELSMEEERNVSDVLAECFRTVRDNGLYLRFAGSDESARVLDRVQNDFIEGNPRALWTGLKEKPVRLGENDRDPYWRLREHIPEDRKLYFIIDIENERYAVYYGALRDIHTFVGDCESLDEYYLLSEDGNELWCATDHDELLYVCKTQDAG